MQLHNTDNVCTDQTTFRIGLPGFFRRLLTGSSKIRFYEVKIHTVITNSL